MITDYDKYMLPPFERISEEELREELKAWTVPQLFALLSNKEKEKYPDDEDIDKEELIEQILENDFYTPLNLSSKTHRSGGDVPLRQVIKKER
jgi:hypothetical protein